MTQAEREAAEGLYKALSLMPCICQREFPYSGKVVKECVRCSAMWKWELAVAVSEGRAVMR